MYRKLKFLLCFFGLSIECMRLAEKEQHVKARQLERILFSLICESVLAATKKAARFSLCHMIVNWVNELKTTVYSCQLFSLFTSIHFRSQSLRTLV